jgi:hypothetical protein
MLMTITAWRSCWLLCSLTAVAGCAETHSLEGTSCPCPGGYSCRLDDNVCITTERIMPSSSALRCTTTAPECTQSERVLTEKFASAEAAREAVTGRWLMCEGKVLEGVVVPPDFRGYDLEADGSWAKLKEVAPGECEHDSGFGNEGTWDVFELESEDGPGRFQVRLRTTGGGEGLRHGQVTVSASPRKLNLLNGLTEVVADPQ